MARVNKKRENAVPWVMLDSYRRAAKATYNRTWRKAHPLTAEAKRRDICRSYLNVMIRRGKIARGPCEVCGTRIKVQAHHDDYAQPLQVRWRCKAHHQELTHAAQKLAQISQFADMPDVWRENWQTPWNVDVPRF